MVDRQLESLHRNRDFNAAVMNTLTALVIVLDREGRIVLFNRACERLTGRSANEVLGRVFWDFLLPPEVVPYVKDIFARLVSGDFPNQAENEWLDRDGNRYLISWNNTALLDESGNVEYIIATGEDITGSRRMEFTLRQSERLYRELFESNHAAMLVINPATGKILDGNTAACGLYGYTRSDLQQLKITDLNILPPEQVFDAMRRARASQRNHFHFQHRRADGSLMDVEVYSSPVLTGEQDLLYSIVLDVTDRNRQVARQAASMAHLDTLVKVSKMILAEKTVEGLLHEIVEAARALTKARIGVAGHGFQQGEFLVGMSSQASDGVPCPSGSCFKIERGGVYQELLGGQTSLRLTDEQLRAHPQWKGLPPDHSPLRGLLAVNLIDHYGKANGLIMVSDKRSQLPDGAFALEDFTEEDEALLVQLAALASLSYQHIQVRDEAERRAEELNTVINSMTEAVGIYDGQGRLIQVNPAMVEFFGFDPRGDYYSEIIPQVKLRTEDGAPVEKEQLPSFRALQGETVRNATVLLTNKVGREIATLASAAPLHFSGKKAGAVLVLHDVSDVREAEEALRASEARLRRLVESGLIGVYYSNAGGRITNANPAFLCMVDCSLEDLTVDQINIRNLTPPEYWEQDAAALQEAREHGVSNLYEKEILQKSGQRVPVLIGTASLEDGSGELISFAVDLTELRQVQESLKAYARKLERSNQDLQDFAFIASHDLQEPLRKIQSFASRVRTRYTQDLDETARDYLQRMESAAHRMQTMVEDLLMYSRVTTQAQPFSKVDLGQVLGQVITDLELRIEQYGGKIDVAPLPQIEADPTQMNQLFVNLVNNALKFHRPDVSPHVRVHARPLPEDRVELVVEDNGIGFEEQYIDQIFLPFQRLNPRTAYEGSGIGLAICRKIVERHGGKITATSHPGEGTRFIIHLPLHQEAQSGVS